MIIVKYSYYYNFKYTVQVCIVNQYQQLGVLIVDLFSLVAQIGSWFLGWPLMLYVVIISLICTIAFRGVQFRYFITAWKVTLFPKRIKKRGDMTPAQAFINTLSASLGNGSIAGIATAIYSGGPGAAFWVVVFGFLLMSVRFAEVYISTLYGARASTSVTLGGPMLYLRHVVGGRFLAYLYAVFCLLFGLTMGNGMQANSIQLSIETTWGVNPYITASVIFAFVLYILFGGAERIIKASGRIVPIKVGVFLISSFIVLIYHYQGLWQALTLITKSAFQPVAIAGGAIGFTVTQAIRYGMARSVFATESGLGTAAILFGFTGSDDPMDSGLMGMVSTFVSTCVCFIVALCIVVSGVWNTGLNSTALTIAAFNTVFGNFGGWIVSFLSISFGIGVLVTYAYISRAAWLFLTNGRFPFVFTILYSVFAFACALLNVETLWSIGDVFNAGLLVINLFGILFLLPRMSKDFAALMHEREGAA